MTASEVKQVTGRIIERLYNDGNPDKATLSALRSTAALDSSRAQKIWPFFLTKLPSKMLSTNGRQTREEKAIFTAVRMYAIHQQANDSCVYAEKAVGSNAEAGGAELFEALNSLKNSDLEVAVALNRRVDATLGSTNVQTVIDQLIHLVQVIKGKKTDIKIDYSQLAGDLYYFQTGYRQANQVRLHWGEQYYRLNKQEQKNENEDY